MHPSIKAFCAASALVLGLPLAQSAQAGAATDALTTCINQHANSADHIVLMKWIFAAMARHPSVADMSKITDAEHVAVTRDAGQLFSRLLTQDCASETGAAFKQDGEQSISKAFESLGSTGMIDIMSQSDVQAATGELNAYIDMPKLTQILTGTAPTKP